MNSKIKISIYGVGNFGYALLKHFDKKYQHDKNVQIHCYDRNETLMDKLHKDRKHLRFHKEISVSNKIIFVKTVKDLVGDSDFLILAVNSSGTRDVCRKIRKHLSKKTIIINTAKSLDNVTGKRLSQIIKEELRSIKANYAMFAGGTIAKDLFEHEPLGADIACENDKILSNLVNLFESDNLSVYPTNDLTGVEYASAFKNVISILAGIVNGMGYSYGSETHLISRMSYEIENIVVNKLGGKRETFSMKRQSWGNDLWMSCTGNTRNREFGILIGKGLSVKDALQYMKDHGKTVEGINTVRVLNKIIDIKRYPMLLFLHKLLIKKTINVNTYKKKRVLFKF